MWRLNTAWRGKKLPKCQIHQLGRNQEEGTGPTVEKEGGGQTLALDLFLKRKQVLGDD